MNVSFSDLADKVAVITGGGGVLCRTIAMGLAEQGVQLAILDIRQEAAQAVADLVTATLWLVSDASSFVHGAVIPVDGGFLAYSGV